MHPLLRLALWTCPREFREEYGSEIARFAGEGAPIETCLDVIGSGLQLRIEGVARDLRLAMRSLARAPLYTVVAAAAIALGIGANVAAASLVKGVLLEPLPFAQPDRLVYASEGPEPDTFSYPDERDLAAQNRTFERVGMRTDDSSILDIAPRPVTLRGSIVDANYFSVLRVPAQLGRLLEPRDVGTRHVVLSDRVWRSHFGADPQLVGRMVHLDDVAYDVVGIAPPQFRDPRYDGLFSGDYWAPINPRLDMGERGYHTFTVWARLRPGVAIEAAHADVQRVLVGLARRFPTNFNSFRPELVAVKGGFEAIIGPVKPLVLLLFCAVAVLLLIACANVANLSLVRATNRRRELAMRTALGASGSRLFAQLWTENAVVASCGALLGLGLGWLGLLTFRIFGSQMLPRWESVHIGIAIVLYALALAAGATLVMTLSGAALPTGDLAAGLKAAGRSGDASGGKRVRAALVVAEVALALGLVTAAGLIARSFVALTSEPVGFEARAVYSLNFGGFPRRSYPTASSRSAGLDALLSRLRKLPNVRALAANFATPFDASSGLNTDVTLGDGRKLGANVNAVTPGYFATLGIPILRGRDFNSADREDSTAVTIVNATFARTAFGTLDVLGKRIKAGIAVGAVKVMFRPIVGVVGDTRDAYGHPALPQEYAAVAQLPLYEHIVIRTNGHDAGLSDAVDTVFGDAAPRLAPPNPEPLGALMRRDALRSQAAAILFAVLAALALVLALGGIYAVTAYSVAQRTQEFGVRKAVGARGPDLLKGVLAGALAQGSLGVALGLALAALFTRLLASVLFDVSPLDPATFAGVVVLLVACTLLAALIPALRATQVDPSTALRYE